MASPHVHYDDPTCPHPGCGHRMEWIDFKLELHGDPEGVYKPLVRSWWDGTGLRRPLPELRRLDPVHDPRHDRLDDDEAARLPHLPAELGRGRPVRLIGRDDLERSPMPCRRPGPELDREDSGVCGGDARIRNDRHTVAGLVEWRQLG